MAVSSVCFFCTISLCNAFCCCCVLINSLCVLNYVKRKLSKLQELLPLRTFRTQTNVTAHFDSQNQQHDLEEGTDTDSLNRFWGCVEVLSVSPSLRFLHLWNTRPNLSGCESRQWCYFFPLSNRSTLEGWKNNPTRIWASFSPYRMYSSSLFPLSSNLGSSPSAKQTAQVIVLYTACIAELLFYFSRTILPKNNI